MLEARECLSLSEENILRFLEVSQFFAENLHGDRTVQNCVFRPQNHAHSSAAQNPLELVAGPHIEIFVGHLHPNQITKFNLQLCRRKSKPLRIPRIENPHSKMQNFSGIFFSSLAFCTL